MIIVNFKIVCFISYKYSLKFLLYVGPTISDINYNIISRIGKYF